MISSISINKYGFDPLSNTFQQRNIKWKSSVFYQRLSIRKKNGNIIQNNPSFTKNFFHANPLKIYRNELAGNDIIGNPSNFGVKLLRGLEQPGSYILSKTDPSKLISNNNAILQETFINSKNIIDGNSTNTVDGKCSSFSAELNDTILVHPIRRDNECVFPKENKTTQLTVPKSGIKMPYINMYYKKVCLSTAGNALSRVRNRGAYNCGGGSGNVNYRPQYTSTDNVNSLVAYINSY